ncbi:MAG: tetratricopeptide repeat protein [Acidobacteria bacterium]|nr:tetratricopeptide repeat protein [Acidobacteriota bacterium]
MARKRYGRTVGKLILGLVLAIIAYLGLQYSAMLNDMDLAAGQYSQGDIEGALNTYKKVESRVRSHGVLRIIPRHDRQDLFLNEARLLYAMGKYDEAAETLEKEVEITGTTTDGRFHLLRGEIGFRKAVVNYRESKTKDVAILEESLLAAEDSLREALRLSPNDWDAKYNFEFVSNVRNMLGESGEQEMQLLQEEKPESKELPPELAG